MHQTCCRQAGESDAIASWCRLAGVLCASSSTTVMTSSTLIRQLTSYFLELCDVEYDRLGCYYDRHQNPRPLPKYILTERQKNLAISTGGEIDWRHYDVYLPRFTCKCAKKALEKGYSTFGIQYYGKFVCSGEVGPHKQH